MRNPHEAVLRGGCTRHHERQLLELFCEVSPEERSRPFDSIEEAIAAFDAEFGN
ncbi:hypothetical protein ACN28I_20000 [Archangium gephyra]|uniref:hypothetical protein n=1 Tax=Archangium gephyra TaxID=48 RepID=UPI003B7E9573